MPFLITDVRKVSPAPGARYLFDANVWLSVLDLNFQTKFSPPYEDFFDSVYGSMLDPKPKIVLPSLLLSEILNRLVNDIYYKEYCLANPKPETMTKHKHFKDFYRVSKEYEQDFAMACGSIRGYHQNVELLSDDLNQFSFKDLTKNIPLHLDFNDHLYCQLAKKKGLTIVTGDHDFAVEDIPIITSHPKLLALKK
jgi:predicted nucleic acid-binding protein